MLKQFNVRMLHLCTITEFEIGASKNVRIQSNNNLGSTSWQIDRLLYFSTGNYNKLKPAKIVRAALTSCGRSIKVEWNSMDTDHLHFGYEVMIESTTAQGFFQDRGFSTYLRSSAAFYGLTINTVYEVSLRVINIEDDNPVTSWAKTKLRTSAGITLDFCYQPKNKYFTYM